MASIDKRLEDELKRFNTIGKYIDETLTEQFVGIGTGSGFVDKQGVSDRLKKFKGEFIEQELPLDPEAEVEELEDEIPVEDEVEGGEEVEIGDEEVEIEEPESDSTELDITDLVNKEDEISNELESQGDILSKNTEGLSDLMTKLDDLETHLGSMDDMMNKISDLESKIEKYRPRTPEEQLELRKHDSGPFKNTLTDFFTDKEEVFDKTGKKQYILKKEDIENYSEVDVKDSFNTTEEE